MPKTKSLYSVFLVLILPFLLCIGCGLFAEPLQFPAEAQCTVIPDFATEVAAVLLDGGDRADLETLVTSAVGRTPGDLLCATQTLVDRWLSQPRDAPTQAALEIALRLLAESNTKLLR